MDTTEYLASFTTLAHVEEEIALMRNNFVADTRHYANSVPAFLSIMRSLQVRRQILMGI